MQGVTWVIHTAAALPLYKKEDIYSTDIEGTRNLLAAAKQAGVARFVHVSSTAVYGIPDHHPLLETDPLQGVGPYGEAKIAAEEECGKFRSQGMCVPVIRPKSFIGPERLGVFALFYDWAKDGHNFPMIGYGHNRYQLLDVEDLCEAIWLCLTLDATKVNDVFNIGAREFTTMREDYQAVLDEMLTKRSEGRKQAVPGIGDHQADWLLVGEGPGAEEDERGEPFVGQAGKLLDNMLAAIELRRGEDVYIANAVKCRPPNNRTPEADESAACRPWLARQIELLQPRLIVALGRPAAQTLLQTEVKIGEARGQLFKYGEIPVIVTYHPAYLLRNPADKAKSWEDLLFARRTMAALKPR